jgi:hypothetical protein
VSQTCFAQRAAAHRELAASLKVTSCYEYPAEPEQIIVEVTGGRGSRHHAERSVSWQLSWPADGKDEA